jgi:hypothetical protein
MTDDTLQHTHLNGIADYIAALDTLCSLARRDLYLFEKDFDGLGFNGEPRVETLRRFLLANPASRLLMLAHDTHYLTTRCPRMVMLLRQFDNRMHIRQSAKNMLHITEPFCVTDDTHYVRRFHFDDPRGILAKNDPVNARLLQSRYMEMWAHTHADISTTTLGL